MGIRHLLCVRAAPSGGGIWFGGDDIAGTNEISLTGCTLSTNNAQYGGALYGAAGGRMLVGLPPLAPSHLEFRAYDMIDLPP